MLNSFGHTAYAVGQVKQSVTHLLGFFLIEAPDSSIPVYAVHLVIKPRRGTLKIRIGKISPLDCHLYVPDFFLHVGNHNRVFQYCFHLCIYFYVIYEPIPSNLV